jgi:hypothetical protein
MLTEIVRLSMDMLQRLQIAYSKLTIQNRQKCVAIIRVPHHITGVCYYKEQNSTE